MKSFYETLGLIPSVDDVVIKAAFKALAQKYHPDKYKGDVKYALRLMVDFNEAYSHLKTKALRQAYDAKLSEDAAKHRKETHRQPKKKFTWNL
jgi:DnaJ-class molecular chaperone